MYKLKSIYEEYYTVIFCYLNDAVLKELKPKIKDTTYSFILSDLFLKDTNLRFLEIQKQSIGLKVLFRETTILSH